MYAIFCMLHSFFDVFEEVGDGIFYTFNTHLINGYLIATDALSIVINSLQDRSCNQWLTSYMAGSLNTLQYYVHSPLELCKILSYHVILAIYLIILKISILIYKNYDFYNWLYFSYIHAFYKIRKECSFFMSVGLM